jgi:SAM-dependent methyltransferase
MPERNIEAFNRDTVSHGGYVYTSVDRWASRVATGKQTDELIRMLQEHFPRSIRIADIGCGDGTFTLEMVERFNPAFIRGIDPAAEAVDVARRRIPAGKSKNVSFELGNIYDVGGNDGEVAVVRGVLHHLDNPKAAIAQLACQFSSVIALEPNGYNPAMKMIERLSSYHRRHDEKSYWPPRLNQWFREHGFSVVSQRFFCLVPYFCPTVIAKALKAVEPLVEALPVARKFACGTNLILYKKSQ